MIGETPEQMPGFNRLSGSEYQVRTSIPTMRCSSLDEPDMDTHNPMKYHLGC